MRLSERGSIMNQRLNRPNSGNGYDAGPAIHVRFGGRSFDVPMADLDLAPGSSDGELKRLLAAHLDVAADRLADHVVDRHPNGNLTVRPAAVFG
jgi:hypothetical protein